jgi:dimethylglycine dehydrogenase
VVIIGGGVVGVSALYHLCKAGWTDCVLLEKNELTAGSTWHAAGNVPTFSTSWSIMNMQRYSTELYRGLGEAVDYAMNYHVTGSIRLGHSEEAHAGIRPRAWHGALPGDEPRNPRRPTRSRTSIPSSRPMTSKGALYDPADGDIDPAQLTQALAKGARDWAPRSCASAPPPASAAKTASGSSIPKRATSAARSW